jgi:hypothetical protein
MSGDPFKRAAAGQPFEPSARQWNAMQDAALAVKNHLHDISQPPIDQFRQADIVRIKNASGQDLQRFSILGIDGVIISPDDNENEFLSAVSLVGGLPETAHHRTSFAILLDPLASGKIGRAWVGGVTHCRVVVNEEEHKWAAVVDGEAGHLETKCAGGGVRILHLEPAGSGSGEETRWAIVRFNNFDPAEVAGWNESSTRQFLAHEEGCMKWIDELSCEELEGS